MWICDMKSTHQEITERINRIKPRHYITNRLPGGVGTEDAVRKAMSRVTKEGKLERLAHGIYFLPKDHLTRNIVENGLGGHLKLSNRNLIRGLTNMLKLFVFSGSIFVIIDSRETPIQVLLRHQIKKQYFFCSYPLNYRNR